MRRRDFLTGVGIAATAGALAGCKCERGPEPLVFAHGKHPRYAFLSEIVRRFETENPDIRVREVVLPSSTDEMHQFFVINQGAGSAEFDVLDLDVIWVPEFARAGWLEDLTPHIGAPELEPLNASARKADWLDGKLYAVPWFVDAGVLYYRRDLLDKYHLAPPVTYPELVEQAKRVLAGERDARLAGFIWQGMQYEGLVCVALEFIRGNGGEVLRDGTRVALGERATLDALRFMDELIRHHGVTPPLVSTLVEESSRHIFQSGRAVFLRNWPYAWRLLNQPDSPVAGRVGLTIVPHFPGHASAPTLGGFHLGVNSRSKMKEPATRFVKFLTSLRSQKEIIRNVGVLAAHTGVYQDAEVRAAMPQLAQIAPALERVQPRPVTPYYLMISQILQPELSAVVANIRSPEEAMRVAGRQIEHLLGASQGGGVSR
jgi:multiple sugar transport system substrate-binding protein